MKEKLKEHFATMIQVSPGDVAPQSSPDDFPKWDSMQHMIIVASVEEEFGVSIDPDEIVEMFESYQVFETTVLGKLD